MNNYISHHGVMGMHWGVRRYQPYGTGGYTPKSGRRKGPVEIEVEDDKRRAGITKLDEHADIIRKGTEIHRVASPGEPVDSRYKYVSITPRDNATYLVEPLPTIGIPVEITYTAIKDLKVAPGKDVVDHILEKYGDETVKSLSKGSRREDRLELEGINADGGYYDVSKRVHKGKIAVSDLIAKNIETDVSTRSEIFEHYRKKGYDAIVDPVDHEGLFEYPVILLNPQESVKKVREDEY